MNALHDVNSCEICGDTNLISVLDLGTHPLCDDLVEVGDTRQCKEYPIEILFCKTCNSAHQKYQVPKIALFPKSYHYRSRFTEDVLVGMSNLVDEVESKLGSLKGKKVLDIGCNDGSLLNFFHAKGAQTIGIEPTGAHQDASKDKHVIFNDYFSPESAQLIFDQFGSLDVITFTNVFAHIENLPEVIQALKILISPKTHIVIENHYLGSVLDKNQFDTFYHEHPRTYSLTSFQFIAKDLGLNLQDVQFPKRYGGNIRIFLGSGNEVDQNSSALQAVLDQEKSFEKRLHEMNHWVQKWKQETSDKIKDLVSTNGKLNAKAFPGRAAILVKLLEIDNDSIGAVYEKPDSMKVGHYLPGTRIPIVSDKELFSKINDQLLILNLAWHIPQEISDYLKDNGFSGKIINVIDDVQ